MSMTSADTRRERQRSEVRQAILDAAEALVVEGGMERLSMRRLAARCGYALPTIYHHFGDKPRLLEALLDARFRSLVDVLARVKPSGDAVRDLRGMLAAVVEFGIHHPGHYQLLVSSLQDGSEPPAAEEARARFQAPILRLLEAGRLRAPDAEAAVQVIWSFVHGLVALRTSRADLAWHPDYVDIALDGILGGVVQNDPARLAEIR
jgi:AcrR family transcriptional regulator